MDTISSMNGMRDDASPLLRITKGASLRRSDDRELAQALERAKGAFDGLLNDTVAVPIYQKMPAETPSKNPQDLPERRSDVSQPMPNQAQGLAIAATDSEAKPSSTPASTLVSTPVLTPVSTPVSTAKAKTAVVPAQIVNGAGETQTPLVAQSGAVGAPATQGQGDTDGLLSKLAALGANIGTGIGTGNSTTPTSQAASGLVNAASLATNRAKFGVPPSQLNKPHSDASSNIPSATTAGPSIVGTPTGAVVVSGTDAVAGTALAKQKSSEPDIAAQNLGKSIEPVSTTIDGAGSTNIVSGEEVVAPANDQTNRAPHLTQQSVAMLAATMMRRLESGSKQFTMRLDPPELGQVEVKLTVGTDKKVRAVVSADRPEALADLVRSARDLTRALLEAGLDLDDNGLTFQMNDQSSGQRQNAHDHQARGHEKTLSHLLSVSEPEAPLSRTLATPSNDPFQRWQRARIALTA